MSAMKTLARMLGVASHNAEDALHSEHAARAALSRRNLFAAAGAMAAGTVFCPAPVVEQAFSHGFVLSWGKGPVSSGFVFRHADGSWISIGGAP